ncbi:flagellar hook protein FlgE [Paraburkholderia caledonica]|uniref:Flagellar hook protein FlgE n=1 Tax=Paraburkholderia caledonica TaxID=134536 RepID=A0ABU1KZ69_9BURK|nr:flagellar hook protein FlgE [Paraburkholderia caledonica]MDR6376213.1 flagellar hook protein FlgE [Paraburkholderia caledonica]
MSYATALSGLYGASSDLDVISNNIANANTVGYKQSRAEFADMYASALTTSVNNQIGIGTRLSNVQQIFTQGTITATDQDLDIAINGNGFFELSQNGSTVYSRNGQFRPDKTGAIVNADGLPLMGYAADSSGVINKGSVVPLQIPTTDLAPTATKKIAASFNLNAQDPVPKATPFSASDSTSYNYPTTAPIYDSLGGSHDVSLYFVKNSVGSWDVYGSTGSPATPVGPDPAGKLGTVTFDSSGNLTSPSPATFAFNIPNGADGGATTQPLTLDLTNTTQYGQANGITALNPDGSAAGQLQRYTVGSDGVITGTYSNGQSLALGQILLANFPNPDGLTDLGGNVYGQTASSGTAQTSTPGSTNHGVLQGGALEESTVDLTSELVNLITAQRDYQANSQSIKTQQTVDQTLINL